MLMKHLIRVALCIVGTSAVLDHHTWKYSPPSSIPEGAPDAADDHHGGHHGVLVVRRARRRDQQLRHSLYTLRVPDRRSENTLRSGDVS